MDLAPHPLFSPVAYRMLNERVVPKGDGTFSDYVKRGCFEDTRTSAIFDPDFYLAQSSAARQALLQGETNSALQHFLQVGINHDAPFSPDFDLDFYLDNHSDVQNAASEGSIPSGTWHFIYFGLQSGYSPNPYFDVQYYRMRYPNARTEMRRLSLGSELEHFLLFGRQRGYKANAPLIDREVDLADAKSVFLRRTRRSWSNIKTQPLDFTPYSGEQPAISVLIPISDGVEFTSRALE